jgi:hypothetical protein
MKMATRYWFGALALASSGLVYCGGDDSSTDLNNTTTGGAGRSTSSSGSVGAGGVLIGSGSSTTTSATGTTGASTTTTGGQGGASTSGTGGSGVGGAGTTTTGGTAGSGGAMGGRAGAGGASGGAAGGVAGAGGVGGPVDAGICPAMQPPNGGLCTSAGEVCDYGGVSCTCGPGFMARDGGARDVWNCVRAPTDAGACPVNPPNNGGFCQVVGQMCDYPTEVCTCQAGGGFGNFSAWVCQRG